VYITTAPYDSIANRNPDRPTHKTAHDYPPPTQSAYNIQYNHQQFAQTIEWNSCASYGKVYDRDKREVDEVLKCAAQ